MNKLELAPDQDSYQVTFAASAIRSDLSVNGRYSEEVQEAWHFVTVAWTADKAEYDYLTQAFRAHEASGHNPFRIDLIGVDGLEKECLAAMEPGSFRLNSVTGETFRVSATLKAKI